MELELAGCQGNLAWHSWRTHKKGNLQVKEEAAAQESNLYYCQTHLAKKNIKERQPKVVCYLFCTHSVEMPHWVQNKSFKIAHKRKLALDSPRNATFTVQGALALSEVFDDGS